MSNFEGTHSRKEDVNSGTDSVIRAWHSESIEVKDCDLRNGAAIFNNF